MDFRDASTARQRGADRFTGQCGDGALVLRIWRTGIDESRTDEYREFARRNSVPMFSTQPGFHGVLFAGAPGQRTVVTLWESRAAAEALEESIAYRHTVAAIEAAGFLDGESHVEILELQDASLGEHFVDAMSQVAGAGDTGC